MSLDWQSNSEIVAGLLIEGRIAKHSVRPELFFPPYDALVGEYQDKETCIEDLIEKIGLAPVQACHDAIKSLNGLGEKNWIKLLEKSQAYYSAGQKLEKAGKRLQRGDEIDWSDLSVISEKAQAGVGGDFTPLSEIKATEFPFIPSGWAIFDEHLSGLPEAGLIVIGGQPGVGKTTFLVKQAEKFVQQYPEKRVVIFSVEMFAAEVANRFNEICKLTDEEKSRILVNDLPVTPEEIINKSATIDNLGLVLIDFIDLLVRGDNSESAYSKIYQCLMLGTKSLHCPIVAFAQLVKYESGIPKPKNLRYTKMAEALAWMILMLYNPNTDWSAPEDDDTLPAQPNRSYLIAWKIRGGFRKHLQDSPGALLIPFRGDKGWGDRNARWFSLSKTNL